MKTRSGIEAQIVVTNGGGPATFSANITFDDPGAVPYVVPWIETKDASVFIERGGSRTLKIGIYVFEGWEPPSPQNTQIHWIRFWQFAAEGQRYSDKGHWVTNRGEKSGPQPIYASVTVMSDSSDSMPISHRYAFLLNVPKRIIEVSIVR